MLRKSLGFEAASFPVPTAAGEAPGRADASSAPGLPSGRDNTGEPAGLEEAVADFDVSRLDSFCE